VASATNWNEPTMGAKFEQLNNDSRHRLEERPRLTLRLRIALVFTLCGLFMSGITIGSLVMLSRFQTKMRFLDAANECAHEIQEARRYEKNYFLYGTNLSDALDHIYRAHRLLEANRTVVDGAIGTETARSWLADVEQYASLLEQFAGDTDSSQSEKHQAEAQLRRYGSAILQDASHLIARQRQSMNDMIRTAMIGAGTFLAFMVLLMLLLADQLARQVLRPIGRFVRYVGRIAEGDFSPIEPARPYQDEFSRLAVAINRMLEELKSRQDQLLQSRKMAAVGTFTSGIAHELNNPLNNISITVETLLDDYEEIDEARNKKLLDDIDTQVQRANATVRNLLDFSRKDQPVLTSVSIADVLESTLKLVGNELKLANVNWNLNVEPDLPPVEGNHRNLQQVFLNLFLNAMQAMPEGGKLMIEATRRNGFIRVSVKDDGLGMPHDDQEKIFDPFFTTKSAGEGTGLGLSVSYNIIEKHGGRFEVESRTGEGTTFHVILPIRTGDNSLK